MHPMENLSETLAAMLSTKDVAERLGVSVAKVHRLVDNGTIVPAFKLDGITGRCYFTGEQIDEYLGRAS
jgi:excisionase family DNA binding protein